MIDNPEEYGLKDEGDIHKDDDKIVIHKEDK
jgi:hypothetical protein